MSLCLSAKLPNIPLASDVVILLNKVVSDVKATVWTRPVGVHTKKYINCQSQH